MSDSDGKRACGNCGQHVIPRGVDWPIWKDGKPICIKCNVMTMPVDVNAMPPCPACGGVVGITHFKTVSCVDCPYDAGGCNDTEDQAIRAHLLHCQRLTALMPVPMVVIPPGWQLVPKEPTEAMWSGLARHIMMWLDFYRGTGDCKPTPRDLLSHLEALGEKPPQWLLDEDEMKTLDHVPSKGSRVVWIYKAMLAEAPAWVQPQPAAKAEG